MGQRTNERQTHCCVVCKRACMDFEELGIGLQQLFGLKCLRSDLVFIVMYLLFVFFFPFCFFCSIDFFSDRSLPVQTLDCRNLKFGKFLI